MKNKTTIINYNIPSSKYNLDFLSSFLKGGGPRSGGGFLPIKCLPISSGNVACDKGVKIPLPDKSGYLPLKRENKIPSPSDRPFQ